MLRTTLFAAAAVALAGVLAPAALAQGKPTPLKAGDQAPDFTLKSWDGKKSYTLSDYRAKGDAKGSIVVVDFWCAKCPASRRADPVLSQITRDYAKKGVVFIAVDSNKLIKGKALGDYIAKAKLPFPVVEDDNFTIADKFGALVTPHVFVVDPKGTIRFAGGMDNRRKPSDSNYQPYLRRALDALLAGGAPAVTKARAYGWGIKRKLRVAASTAKPSNKPSGGMDAPGMDGPKMDGPKMDAPKMDAPAPSMDMAGKGATAKAKPDAARLQAQLGFMKARRLGEDAAKLRAAGAAAERPALQALRTRFDRLDRSLRAIKTSDASTKKLLQKARRQLDAADRSLIDTRLSLDLEQSKQRAKKKPAPAEDF